MAYINGNDQLLVKTTLKGDSVFVRYSANADGTDFTETPKDGQNYIGIATGKDAPTDKSEYDWFVFGATSGGGTVNVTVEGERLKIS